MVRKRLLDTDILTYFFRRHPQVVANVASYLQTHERLSLSIISYYELLRGLRYVQARRHLNELEHFIDDSDILPLSIAAADKAADIYAALRRQGALIGEADILIAGIALAHDAVLVTNNVSHSARVPGLTVENWAE